MAAKGWCLTFDKLRNVNFPLIIKSDVPYRILAILYGAKSASSSRGCMSSGPQSIPSGERTRGAGEQARAIVGFRGQAGKCAYNLAALDAMAERKGSCRQIWKIC